jgi:hypothetical protein
MWKAKQVVVGVDEDTWLFFKIFFIYKCIKIIFFLFFKNYF